MVTAQTWEPLETACDEVAEETLAEAGMTEPPFDMFDLSERLGLLIAFDERLPGRARLKRIRGTTAVLLKPDPRPERLQWAAAHEIGESLSHRVFRRLDGQDAAQWRERTANELASRLLLPPTPFCCDAQESDGDLFELKRLYATASHELILMNLLRLPVLSIVTVFDNGRTTRRVGNGRFPPPSLLPIERSVWQTVRREEQPHCEHGSGVRAHCWPVHEPRWQRELLRTVAIEDFQ